MHVIWESNTNKGLLKTYGYLSHAISFSSPEATTFNSLSHRFGSSPPCLQISYDSSRETAHSDNPQLSAVWSSSGEEYSTFISF